MGKERRAWYQPVVVRENMKKKWPIVLEFSDRELSTLGEIIVFLADDDPDEAPGCGFDLLSYYVFETLDMENIKIWLSKVAEALDEGGDISVVVTNAIGFRMLEDYLNQQD